MKTMVVLATLMSVIPLLCSFFMPNWYLGDTQNAVDIDADADAEVYADADADADAVEEDMLIGGRRRSGHDLDSESSRRSSGSIES